MLGERYIFTHFGKPKSVFWYEQRAFAFSIKYFAFDKIELGKEKNKHCNI